MKRLEHHVPSDASPTRLDRFLAEALGVSRAQIKAAFDAGEVRVDGRRARKSDPATPGSLVTALLAETIFEVAAQPELPLSILLADDAFLVLDKPAGMSVHPLEEDETGTLANALAARHPECRAASPIARECGFVHRLDRDTSGAILVARARAPFDALRLAFQERRIEKRYLALVGGVPVEGEIELPIAHHPKNARKMIACLGEEEGARLHARPALTRVEVIERLGDLTLVSVEIPTGVMHQIRVHLAAVGAPVAGDTLYGGPAVRGLGHHFLHATTLAFEHPVHGGKIAVQSPLPETLSRLLDALRAGG